MPNKTQPTKAIANDFLSTIQNEQQLADSKILLQMMETASGHPPEMWGTSIIGFGRYHYVYPSGREGDWMEIGFSPRKQAISIYLIAGVGRQTDNLAKLGKHKIGKSCLYIKRLSDIDLSVLRNMLDVAITQIRNKDVKY